MVQNIDPGVDQAHLGLGKQTVKVIEGSVTYDEEFEFEENSQFVNLLRECSVVEFEYIKKNGTKRLAHGTLKKNVLEKSLASSGKKFFVPQSGRGLTVYWDLDAEKRGGASALGRGDFRSYFSEKLVRVISVEY